MNDRTHVAILVPERMVKAVSDILLAEIMFLPGARISTLPPKLENEAKVSSMVVAPTVMTPST